MRIVCGKYSEEAQGRTLKEAKILAADCMSKKLDMLFNKSGYNPFFSSVSGNPFDDLNFITNQFNNEIDEDKENSSKINLKNTEFNSRNTNFVQKFGGDSDQEDDLSTFLQNNEEEDEEIVQVPNISKQGFSIKKDYEIC